jgi:S1-C subfamily serine protease
MGEYSLMQISVPVQPGNSGGPLVDVSGGVIGMVTSTIAVEAFFKETGTLPQNINWAVKADYIIPLVPHQRLSETEIETKNTISDPVALVKKSVCLVKTK